MLRNYLNDVTLMKNTNDNRAAFHLMTPTEVEEVFGAKYFYRQRLYRLAKSGKIPDFKLRSETCYLGTHVLGAFLKDLEIRIQSRFPEIDISTLRVFYDAVTGKRIVVDGLFSGSVAVNTDSENEEDLLLKIANVVEWIGNSKFAKEDDDVPAIEASQVMETHQDVQTNVEYPDKSLSSVLPEEITWIRVDTNEVNGVQVKSFILISLPSIAQFVGIRSDALTRWIIGTDFINYVLSAHYKQIQGTQNSVPWKKGVVDGYTPLIPFELVPEIIVALRQAGLTPKYQEKADLLYKLAKQTLEAVGLAISGSKDKAAEELARVGEGLGLNVAEQIIGVFKQYETREFQIKTTKEFNSKVKEIGANYAVTVGNLTFGITGRYPAQWKMLGIARKLPKKIINSSREIMREVSPEDGVGMTFGQSHYAKDPNLSEAVQTGIQGKDFYLRLKKVGLLEK